MRTRPRWRRTTATGQEVRDVLDFELTMEEIMEQLGRSGGEHADHRQTPPREHRALANGSGGRPAGARPGWAS